MKTSPGFFKCVEPITLLMKPQTPLMQAKHWGIFCWTISRPRLSSPVMCLNDRAVYRVAFAEPYAGSVEALFSGCPLSTGAMETELKRSWQLHCYPCLFIIYSIRPLAGFEFGKGAMGSRLDGSIVRALSPQVDLPAISPF